MTDPRPPVIAETAPGLSALARVHLFPIRHHSPRTTAVLAAFLADVNPELILVEGPEDANSLIDVLVDAGTRPPVAILAYRTDGMLGSSLWPCAAYSPEYAALKWGVAHGKEVAFIDIASGTSLASDVTVIGPPPGTPAPLLLPYDACARARGYRSFEEFWEASFEAPSYEPGAFRAALMAYADLVRATDRQLFHLARDAHMASRVLARLEGGLRPEQIVVVAGAAHVAAFAAKDVDLALARHLPPPLPSAVTLIPFSFPRLAEKLGYGAGNRAPQFYQRAHDAGCDFKRATLEVLVEFTEHLRLRGFMASLADTIEAYRLAVALAGLRGKAEPGLDEVREATVATMCRGDATHVDGFLWPSVIGHNVGRVADRIGKNSLQAEFWGEVEQRRLPRTDAIESFVLKLNDPVQVRTSVFLHRLRVAGVPYAGYIGKHLAKRGARGRGPGAGVEQVGEIDALTRVSEAWEAQWTPSTDIALVERIVHGNTLEQVTARVLDQRLRDARKTGDAADVLLEAVVTGSAQTVTAALTACDGLASSDDDLPSLSRAATVLSGLVSYGSSRALADDGDTAIRALCEKTFERAVLRAEDACTGTDDAVQKPKEALKTLHGVALAQPSVDRDAWFTAARRIVESYAVNPGASGLACALLYLAQVLGDDDIARIVGQRLSNALDPAGAAGFLEGFFEVNALALVKSRPVVRAIDAFLNGIDSSRFRDTLPVLRRAFAALGPTERRYLLENVLGARGIGETAREAHAILLEKDREKLKAMSDDLSKAMSDLDDLL